jgi:hypothetical protein
MDNQSADQNIPTQDAPQAAEAPNANPAPQPTNTETPSTPPKATGGKKIAIIASIATIAVVLIIGVVFLLISLNKDSDSEKTNANKDSSQEEKPDETPDDNSQNKKKTAVQTSWEKLEFSIDGVKKQLPITEEDLMEGLDGWGLVKDRETSGGFTIYNIRYEKKDREIHTKRFELWLNDSTKQFFYLTHEFNGPNDNSMFEVNGIDETSLEKDVHDKLGKPTSGVGKYADNPNANKWIYRYMVNGKIDEEDGLFFVRGKNSDNGYVDTIILSYTKGYPDEENNK